MEQYNNSFFNSKVFVNTLLLNILFQLFCIKTFAQKNYSLKEILDLHSLLGVKKEHISASYKLNPILNYDLSDIISRTYFFESFIFINSKSSDLKIVYFNTDSNSVVSSILVCNKKDTSIYSFLINEYSNSFNKVVFNNSIITHQWTLKEYCILTYENAVEIYLIIFNCNIESFFRYPNLLR